MIWGRPLIATQLPLTSPPNAHERHISTQPVQAPPRHRHDPAKAQTTGQQAQHKPGTMGPTFWKRMSNARPTAQPPTTYGGANVPTHKKPSQLHLLLDNNAVEHA